MTVSETRSTSIIRKKQKEMHVPAMSLEKTAFDMSGFEPWTFWSRVSDVPTRAIGSNNLKINDSSEFIYNKTWTARLGQLQAMTMALRSLATSSVRGNSHLNWFNVQDAEYYVRRCNLLIFIISGSVWNFDGQNPLWTSRFRRICGTAYKW